VQAQMASPCFLTNSMITERIAEEQRRAEEEAAANAAAEAKRREEAEKTAALRKQREEERAAAAESARRQQEREAAAEARIAARAAERAKGVSATGSRVTNGEGAWRRSGAPSSNTLPSTRREPVHTPPRAESPAPKFRPGATAGWRAREEAKAAAGRMSPSRTTSLSTPNSGKEEPKKDDDGFQTVPKKEVWKPRARGN
jgi:translation initiation factor 3 subunit A